GLPVRALWPNKLVDYMAAGRPVVAPEHDDLRPLFSAHCIGSLAVHTPQDFAEKTVAILRHPERGEEWGQRARKVIEEYYNWDTLAARFESFIGSVHR